MLQSISRTAFRIGVAMREGSPSTRTTIAMLLYWN
jgi:hypothetical protein